MGIVMGLDGLNAVVFAMEGELNRRKTKTGNIVQTAGIMTEGDAKQACPVDTGRLRASIHYEKIDTLHCSVGTNVNYAADVEYGHRTRGESTVAPRPYLIPAFIKNREEMLAQCQKLAQVGSSGWSD